MVNNHNFKYAISSWIEVIRDEAPVTLQWLVVDAGMGDKELKKTLLFTEKNAIQTIVQMNLPQSNSVKEEIEGQIKKIAQMGVQWVMPEGFPNMQSYWGIQWARGNILSTYYEMFRSFARTAVNHGVAPILPVLIPGGDIWDTIFLQSILNQLTADNEFGVIEKLALSSAAFTYGHQASWGKGGGGSWLDAKPYHTPQGSEDQRGMNAYQWYVSISKEILQRDLPVFIFYPGWESHQAIANPSPSPFDCVLLDDFFSNLDVEEDQNISTKKPVICLFNLELSDLRVAQQKLEDSAKKITSAQENILNHGIQTAPVDDVVEQVSTLLGKPIFDVYLLLPVYEWGVSDWHLEVIQPFIKKSKATVGFSWVEASNAKKVIVVGGVDVIPDSQLAMLQKNGCEVCRIHGDGTEIASQMKRL